MRVRRPGRVAIVAVCALALLAVCSVPRQDAAGPGAGGGPRFTIRPESASLFRGPQGGPFEPGRRALVLRNDGDADLSWAASTTTAWLRFPGPAGGVVPAHGEVSVEVALDAAAAAALPAGAHGAIASFWITGPASFVVTRRIELDVAEPEAEPGEWTTFRASADTRTVYVSPSGDDSQDGSSPAKAKRTLAAAIARLRHGHPDWLLLERGGVWHESLGQWVRSGRSAREPMLVSSYGSEGARPRLLTGREHGIHTEGGGGSPARIEHLALVGLGFVADGYDGTSTQIGARLLQPATDLLIEDCVFSGYGVNLVVQGYGGRHSDVRLRRSVIVDSWALHETGHSQGLYAYAVDGLLVEGNLFDHNGWKDGVPGAGADMFNHNLYIDNDNTGVVVRGNIIANAASHGLQLRPGGVCEDNLFVRNSIALQVGGGNHPDPGGVLAEVHQNVILDGKNIDAAQPRGWGLWMANIASGHVSGNIIANNVSGASPVGIGLDGSYVGDDGPASGVHDLVLEDNIVYDWGGNLSMEGVLGQLSGIAFLDNDVQDLSHPHSLIQHDLSGSVPALTSSGNRCFSQPLPSGQWAKIGTTLYALTYWQSLVGDATTVAQQVDYLDPTRSPASWNALLGGASTLTAFLAQARLQSSTNWQPEYSAVPVNEYVRAGFAPGP